MSTLGEIQTALGHALCLFNLRTALPLFVFTFVPAFDLSALIIPSILMYADVEIAVILIDFSACG